jgi:hypothetical protein
VLSDLRKELANYVKVKNKVEEVADWRVGAVWPEHLLHLTDNAVSPGKEMLVRRLMLDSQKTSNNIDIKKLETTEWQVATEFANNLGKLTGPDGERLYKVTQRSSRSLKSRDSDFTGAVEIQVDLLDLKRHLETQDERARARRRALLQ